MTKVGRVDPRRVVGVTGDGQSYSAIVVDARGVENLGTVRSCSASELLRDPYFLVGPIDGTQRIKIGSLGDLAGTPIVAPRTCRSWAMIAGMLRAAGVEPMYAFRTDDNVAVKGLVQSGAGVAFLTRLTLEMMGDDLRSFSVDHLVPSRRIALTWCKRRALLPLQQLFVSLTREVCCALAETSAETSALRHPVPLEPIET